MLLGQHLQSSFYNDLAPYSERVIMNLTPLAILLVFQCLGEGAAQLLGL